MDKQDFEKYAELKPFNYNVAPSWEKVFAEYLQGHKNSFEEIKILDYGCGDGKYFPFFVKNGFKKYNIYGVEVSKKE